MDLPNKKRMPKEKKIYKDSSRMENSRHNRLRKLRDEDVIEIKKMIKEGKRNREIASIFEVSLAAINCIRIGDSYKYISI